jgi:hypothetical protein
MKIDFRKPVFVDDALTIAIKVVKDVFVSAKITNKQGQVMVGGDIKSI